MSDYEYRDADGARLNVDGYATNINAYVTDKGMSIGVLIPREDAPAVALAILGASGIKPNVMPPTEFTDGTSLEAAAYNLHTWQKNHSERAEREAEDAKVRAYLSAKHGGDVRRSLDDVDREEYRRVAVHFQQDSNLPAPGFIADRPRTVESIDDLTHEHRRREWVDQDGLIWSWDYKHNNWGYRTRNGKYRTVDIPDSFPWTEKAKDPEPRVLNYGDPEPDRDTKWRDTEGDVWEWSQSKGTWIADGATPTWGEMRPYWFPMTEVTS